MAITLYLQTTQFQMRKDAVTHVLTGPKPFEVVVLPSTEADIRATMAIPADNWGNLDALADAQAKMTTEYPAFSIVVELAPPDNT